MSSSVVNRARQKYKSELDRQVKAIQSKIASTQRLVSKLDRDRTKLETDLGRVRRESQKANELIEDLSATLTSFLRRNAPSASNNIR